MHRITCGVARIALACSIVRITSDICVARPDYAYHNITDSNGPLANFSSSGAAINSSGVVAFMGTRPGDKGNGIFRSFAGGSVGTIAVAAGSLNNGFAGTPSINDVGVVAFYNGDSSGPGGVFVGSGGNITPIASTNGAFVDFAPLAQPSINNSGAVVFSATQRGSNKRGIFVGSGGAITTIALAPTPSEFFGFIPDINASGTCVFTSNAGTFQTIYSANGGPLNPIADNAGPLQSFGVGATMNDDGVVAFGAEFDAGGSAVFTRDGAGPLTMIADSFGPYENLVAIPNINNAGTVAFYASLDNGGEGIFTGPNAVADRVIASGDALFGSTVMHIGFIRGLNDRGDVAFEYELANGTNGIAIAAVPEPTTLGVAAAGIAMVRARRRRVARRNNLSET